MASVPFVDSCVRIGCCVFGFILHNACSLTLARALTPSAFRPKPSYACGLGALTYLVKSVKNSSFASFSFRSERMTPSLPVSVSKLSSSISVYGRISGSLTKRRRRCSPPYTALGKTFPSPRSASAWPFSSGYKSIGRSVLSKYALRPFVIWRTHARTYTHTQACDREGRSGAHHVGKGRKGRKSAGCEVRQTPHSAVARGAARECGACSPPPRRSPALRRS